MVCTLNDIYKQYNKLHEHWYTKISSLRCVADRNPPQNASDLYTRYWSDAEHCRPCTRLSGVNWWKQKQITLIVPIGYSLFADHRSVPSSGPGLVCLTILCLSRVRVHRFRDNAVTGDIPLISPVLESMVPLSTWYRMSGTSGIYYFWQPDRLCSSPPLLGFYWNRWGGNSFASGLNAYNLQTTLIQYDSIYTKIWARSWKNPVPRPRLITEHCACASPDLDPTHPCDKLTQTGFSMTWLISHIAFKWFNMIFNENVQSFHTYWNEPIIQHYSTASWTTFHILDRLSC